MLAGHFAVAFIAKRIEPKISLGTLVFAAMLADLLWCVFLIAGVESVGVKAGIVPGPSVRALDVLEAREIGFSHSLLADLVWAVIFAGLYLLRGNRRGAWILLGAVVSHWVLDVASHPPDMPIAPAIPNRFGLGLWNSVPATIFVEGLFWLIALAVYMRASRDQGRFRTYLLWAGVVLITVAWLGNITGPPPSEIASIGFSSLTFFSLSVIWAYWVDRLQRSVYDRQGRSIPVRDILHE
jgi:LexA-binding, inner membrane-associated putative hydrolase